jgi:hypothetical protein
MTLYTVNTGNGPNSHDGDSLRTAFNKINANFTQINTGSLGAVLVQSPSVPQGYGPGTLWYDTESGRTYIYYNNSWVDANPSSNQNSSKVSVSLYNPDTQLASNTVTNVTSINFDSLADFSVTSQGNGGVLIGMNSTFKYIQIDGQETLTAQGVDTLTLVAGTGTQLVTSNAGLKNQQTITFISTGSGSGNATFPTTSTAGYLYTDGADNISWQPLSASTLTNGNATFGLNSDGSVTFNNNTTQRTAYVAPVSDSTNLNHNLVFLGNTGAFQFNSSLYYNPSTRQFGKITTLLFNDNTAQTTAWPGTTSTLVSSSSGVRSVVSLSTATLKLSTGTITFPDLSVQRTAFTGTVEYSKLTGVPVVTTSSLNNNGFTAELSTSGSFTIPGTLNISYLGTPTLTMFTSAAGGVLASVSTTTGMTIQTTSTSTVYNWTFNNNGTVTFPDGTTQYTAGRNVYSSIFSGTKSLTIFSNGVVQYPDNTNQTTAFTGSAINLKNGAYALRPVAVPNNIQYGAPLDQIGDIAIDQNYLYYCIAPYGFKTYTTGTYNSGVNVNYIKIPQSSTGGIIPQPGWTFQQVGSSTVYTVSSYSSSSDGPTSINWILTSSTAVLNYSSGTIFTVTNTTSLTPNWVKTAVTTAGLVTSLSNFVNQDTPISNGVISVQWKSVLVFNQNSSQLTIAAVSGTISDVVYNLTSVNNGAISVESNFLTQMTATLNSIGPYSSNAGDSATLIISSASAKFSYRVTAMTGNNFANNFISIEKLL